MLPIPTDSVFRIPGERGGLVPVSAVASLGCVCAGTLVSEPPLLTAIAAAGAAPSPPDSDNNEGIGEPSPPKNFLVVGCFAGKVCGVATALIGAVSLEKGRRVVKIPPSMPLHGACDGPGALGVDRRTMEAMSALGLILRIFSANALASSSCAIFGRVGENVGGAKVRVR